ncbi:MAG: hypothetical protein FWF49_01985, partial [Oscillospiraceae bacterium]|nr:hypothetical protein [Oscillospiraceae bacterium]
MKRSRILAPFAALLCVLLTVSLAACRTDPSVGGQAQPVATTDAAQAAAAQGAVSSGGLPGATTTVPAGTAPAGGSATAQTGYMPSATMVYPSG